MESGRRPRPLSGLSSGVDGAPPLSFDLPRSSAGRSLGLRLLRLRRSSQFFPRSSSRSFTQRSLLRLRLRCLTRPKASGFTRRSIPFGGLHSRSERRSLSRSANRGCEGERALALSSTLQAVMASVTIS